MTDEGADIVKMGSHEARVYNAIDRLDGTLQNEIMASSFSASPSPPPPTHTLTVFNLYRNLFQMPRLVSTRPCL